MLRNLLKSTVRSSSVLCIPKQSASTSKGRHFKPDPRFLLDNEEYEVPKGQLQEDGNLVYSALVLERPPIILPKMPDWEVDWYKYEDSKMSEEALVVPKDLREGMYGKALLESFADESVTPIYPNITEEDTTNNRRSVYRALDEPLYLIFKVEQDFDAKLPKYIWTFPQTEIREGETLRTACQRTLFYHGGEIATYMLGNGPIMHLDNDITETQVKAYPEAKKTQTFFMHGLYLRGNVEVEGGEIEDFAWVRASELPEYFTDSHTERLLALTKNALYYIKPE